MSNIETELLKPLDNDLVNHIMSYVVQGSYCKAFWKFYTELNNCSYITQYALRELYKIIDGHSYEIKHACNMQELSNDQLYRAYWQIKLKITIDITVKIQIQIRIRMWIFMKRTTKTKIETNIKLFRRITNKIKRGSQILKIVTTM